MKPTDRIDIAKQRVVDTFNKNKEVTDQFFLTTLDVYVVWFSFTLGNWKALLSTTVVDGKYYEVTYNAAKDETYVDTYVKLRNEQIKEVTDESA